MSGMTGSLAADFASFFEASEKAVVSLTSFEAGGAKVETQLNRVANAFSGKKTIQEATLMAEVFTRAGGSATFTSAELARMGSVGSEAMEKLRRNGEPIPPQLMAMGRATRDLGEASGGAGGQVNQLQGQLQAFDGVLRAAGVNLGPEISGLSDLGAASGKTAAQLGVVGVTGLAVGAAVGGWKIGRAISEFVDLDKIIGDATAKLFGFGDAAGEAAGAKADVLARASEHAGFAITDLTSAIEINRQALVGWRSQTAQSAAAIAPWQAELARVGDDLPQLTADLKSQYFSLKELADRYHVSVEALQFFTREQANVAQAVTDATAKIEASNKRIADQTAKDLKTKQDEFAFTQQLKAAEVALAADAAMEEVLASGTASDIIKAKNHEVYLAKLADLVANKTDTKANLDAIAAFEDAATQHDLVNQQTLHTGRLKDAQDRAAMERRTYDEMIAHADQYTHEALQTQLDKVRELETASSAMGRAAVDAQDSAKAAAKKHSDELEKQLELNEALIRSRSATFDITAANFAQAITQSTFGAVSGATGYNPGGQAHVQEATDLAGEGYSFTEILAILRTGQKYKPIGPRIPGFAGGIEGFGGGLAMVGERGPELVNLPGGSDVIPLGGGRGLSIVVHQYITGVIDQAMARKLTDAVGTEVMNRLRLGRQLSTA